MLGSRPTGMGFLPLIAAGVSAAGGIMAAKSGSDAAKDSAKAQIEIAKIQARAAAAAEKARGKTISSWVPLAVAGVALIGVVWAVAAAAKSKGK